MLKRLMTTSLAIILAASPAMAQEAQVQGALDLDLNAMQATDTGCKVAFVAKNGLEGDIDTVAFEMALFGTDGGLQQLVTLEFADLTAGKTKVLQFNLPGVDCGSVGRILINDVTACDGDIAETACLDALKPATRLDVTFGI